ncbi:MAG: hypothetical protein J6M92_03105 [Oribacterium sp.]|nr:hypothetical protein [Oribacterium sp.]
MIELFSENLYEQGRQSSKGNQLKWNRDGYWYKADYTGYEGLSEYVVSKLLTYSNIHSEEFVLYDTEQIHYKNRDYLGCKSKDFLEGSGQLITLERLYKNQVGDSFYQTIFHFAEVEDRACFLVDTMERLTGIKGFGEYLVKLLIIDGFFLNEDRHLHNIAVIMDEQRKYHLCPFFDQGAALLSDISVDYPMGTDIYELMDSVHSKTISRDFEEQMETVANLYGDQLKFRFTKNHVRQILEEEPFYPEDVKKRVENIIYEQMRKYVYLFED